MPLVLTSTPADLKTQSGREAQFGRHRFLTEHTPPVCDSLLLKSYYTRPDMAMLSLAAIYF